MDNRHHAEDVIAGWTIGATVALSFFVRAAATADDVATACDGGLGFDRQLQLSESGEGSDVDSPLCSPA